MFAVVKILECEKTLSARIKYRLHKPVPKLERINVNSFECFYYLEIYREQCGEGFENAAEILGRCSKLVIPCDNYSFPESSLIRTVNVTGFQQIILLNTALDLLESREYDAAKFRLCLFDPEAKYSHFVEDFVGLAYDITVSTDYPDKYSEVCEGIYKKWGASVVLKDGMNNLTDYDMIVSPDFNVNKFLNNSVIIKNASNSCFDVLRGYDIIMPDSVRRIMPRGVNKTEFLYSLYKYCNCRELGRLRYNDFKVVHSFR